MLAVVVPCRENAYNAHWFVFFLCNWIVYVCDLSKLDLFSLYTLPL